MDSDLILTAGLLLVCLSIPSAVAAFADRRTPWVALSVVILGAAIFAWGWMHHPQQMSVAELPHVLIRVLARVLP